MHLTADYTPSIFLQMAVLVCFGSVRRQDVFLAIACEVGEMQNCSCPVFNQQSSPRERYYCALTKSSLIVQVVMKNLCSITDTLVTLPVIRLQDVDPLSHQLIVLHWSKLLSAR